MSRAVASASTGGSLLGRWQAADALERACARWREEASRARALAAWRMAQEGRLNATAVAGLTGVSRARAHQLIEQGRELAESGVS